MSSAKDHLISSQELQQAISHAATITNRNIIKFQDYFPRPHSIDGRYPYSYNSLNDEWMQGFWCGLVWLLYELQRKDYIRCYGEKLTGLIYQSLKKKGLSYNDIGFLVILSCGADYSFTGSNIAKEVIISAADSLLTKFHRASNILCSRDDELDSDIISSKISSLLNSQLLLLATGLTNNAKYSEIAQKNIDTVMKYNIMEDGTAYFYSYFDQKTGTLLPERYLPGSLSQNSRYGTRNYAWAMYGLASSYCATHLPEYASHYDLIFHHLTRHWDAQDIFHIQIPGAPTNLACDSTSTAIITASLLEMAKHSVACNSQYHQTASLLLRLLMKHYAVSSASNGEGLLTGAYFGTSLHYDIISTLCGDYFYMEALLNYAGIHHSFWYLD